jgi:hypothetical protein
MVFSVLYLLLEVYKIEFLFWDIKSGFSLDSWATKLNKFIQHTQYDDSSPSVTWMVAAT